MLPKRLHCGAFTLIELICVMAILATIMAVSGPSLSNFFRGRNLHEETRRFLALTRYARELSVSAAANVELWIDAENGRYGVDVIDAYGSHEKEEREFQLPDTLQFDIDIEFSDDDGLTKLVFFPDGLPDEGNPEEIKIVRDEKDYIVVSQLQSALGYVIEKDVNYE